MSFLDTLKRAAFEDDTLEKKDKTETGDGRAPAPVIPLSTETADEVYQRLSTKTSFESTEAGGKVHKYLNAISGASLDQNTRLKVALGQAKSIDGLTDEEVLGSFDKMATALEAEQESFQENATHVTADEVEGRRTRIADLNQEIAALQQKMNGLQEELAKTTTEMAEWQGKVARIQSQFQAAVQRRTGEILQEKSRMASLLKG